MWPYDDKYISDCVLDYEKIIACCVCVQIDHIIRIIIQIKIKQKGVENCRYKRRNI